MKNILLLIALALTSMTATAEQIVYVQSAKAKILNAPNFNATVIANVSKGTELLVIQRDNRWLKVKHANDSGWISKLLVNDMPPHNKVSVLEGNQESLQQHARRRASANQSAAATRGLRDGDRQRLETSGQGNFHALEKIEAMQIDQNEVWQFHDEGNNH